MVKKVIAGWLVLSGFWVGLARAEWTSLSNGLPEINCIALAVHPNDARTIYVATEKNVYKTVDAGSVWKKVLALRGAENRVNTLLVEPGPQESVWVGTEHGLQRSQNGGKSWATVYKPVSKKAKSVTWISTSIHDGSFLWIGTGDGLYRVRQDGNKDEKMHSLPGTRVYSGWSDPAGQIVLTTDRGIFQSLDEGLHWDRVLSVVEGEKGDAEGNTLEQFSVEELSTTGAFSNMIYQSSTQKMIAASRFGLYESDAKGNTWNRLQSSLPSQKINYIASSGDDLYIATDRGVLKNQLVDKSFHDLSEGLPSKEVRMILFHEGSQDLFAATKKGLYRFAKPAFMPTAIQNISELDLNPAKLLDRFRVEPTILQVQDAAIRYAEVHPEKIKAWREAASKKALWPTVSLTAVTNKNQNVDIDRGGTNDPDRFIVGPAEKSQDWHAGLSWDLGDLVWNDDQTSIDTRSKLMVELRDDLLNEVTHLYFERRRLQVEMILSPAKELPLQLEKELKLQELTAGIDGLTGGAFSKSFKEGAGA